MQYVPAKTIIQPVKNGSAWFGHDYNMNIYRGCSHGCIYCDSRSDCYQIEDFNVVRAKENALNIIENDLKKKRKKGVVGTGAMSDPYNPFEKELHLTRDALFVLDKYRFGASITTKSSSVTRDIDVFQKIMEHSPTIVNITITTHEDELCKKIEPNVSVTSERFEAIRKLSDAGIFVGILMMPLLPFVNDTVENVRSIVEEAHEQGAKFIFPAFGMTTRVGQREWYLKEAEKIVPGLKDKYGMLYGDSYMCTSPNHKDIRRTFERECDRFGIIYEMNKIIEAYKREIGTPSKKIQSTLANY
jgi:DNA repair photolyase